MRHLSIVIPVLNDGPALARLLGSGVLQGTEIVVVDGGSTDSGCTVAQQHECVLLHCPASRGAQLHEGFLQAQGEWIWLLHADSMPDAAVLAWLMQPRQPCWGRFDVRFGTRIPLLNLVANMMNWRSRLSGICTGDQGIFAHRSLLTAIGGVPPQPLMEDIELSRRLKRMMPPVCPRLRITASSRRWERRGVVRTIVSMWRFRLRYWLGADPQRLAGEYYS